MVNSPQNFTLQNTTIFPVKTPEQRYGVNIFYIILFVSQTQLRFYRTILLRIVMTMAFLYAISKFRQCNSITIVIKLKYYITEYRINWKPLLKFPTVFLEAFKNPTTDNKYIAVILLMISGLYEGNKTTENDSDPSRFSLILQKKYVRKNTHISRYPT